MASSRETRNFLNFSAMGLLSVFEFSFQLCNIRIMAWLRLSLRGSQASFRYGWPYPHLKAAEKNERAEKKRDNRNEIGCQPIGWLIQYLRTVMFNKILFDFCFTSSLCQHFTDQITPLAARLRGTYIQWCALTNRAI